MGGCEAVTGENEGIQPLAAISMGTSIAFLGMACAWQYGPHKSELHPH